MNQQLKRRGFRFYASIYFKIIAQDFKSKMSYRADFIISTLGQVLTNIAGFISFFILFQNFETINGWNYYEMLFLYGFTLVALTPMQCLFDNNWHLRRAIYTGDFIKYCFRPINIFFYFISEVFDVKGLGQFVMGIITLAYAWNKLELAFSFTTAVLLVIMLLTASMFMVAIMNFAASACFWIVNANSVMTMMFKFTDYAKYPATIYKGVVKVLFTFIIPVAFVAYYPSLIFLRPGVSVLTCISPIFGMFFFWLSYKVWMIGASRYSGTGN